jgi:hypothetical protein
MTVWQTFSDEKCCKTKTFVCTPFVLDKSRKTQLAWWNKTKPQNPWNSTHLQNNICKNVQTGTTCKNRQNKSQVQLNQKHEVNNKQHYRRETWKTDAPKKMTCVFRLKYQSAHRIHFLLTSPAAITRWLWPKVAFHLVCFALLFIRPMRPNLETTGSPFEDPLAPQHSNQCFPILEPRVPSSRN